MEFFPKKTTTEASKAIAGVPLGASIGVRAGFADAAGSAGGHDQGKTPQTRGERPGEDWIAAAVQRFEGPLVLYVGRILGEVEAARDVVQDAFLSLCEQPRGIVEPHLAEWLYTVCRNKAFDVRRKGRHTAPLGQDLVQDTSREQALPGDVLEQRETADRMLRLLEHLPINQQEVIRLKFQGGLSYKEISGVTSLSVSNVGFLIHTGLKTLREKMTGTRQ